MAEIIALDPGYAIGVASGHFSDTEPLQFDGAAILTYDTWPGSWDLLTRAYANGAIDYIVAEKFELSSGNDFTADLTPVKIEGTLDLLGPDVVHWRGRESKQQVPDDLLKKIGWWQTGADVNWEDGRDANDAIIHLLGFVAFNLRHRPTLEAYFKE